MAPGGGFIFICCWKFQSSVDLAMPLRMNHYVVCFYQHLLKTGQASLAKDLPPIFPIVLYNGNRRWSTATYTYELINPQPQAFMRPYQPRLQSTEHGHLQTDPQG